jgi:hypothetical protein
MRQILMDSKYSPVIAQLLTYNECQNAETWPDYLAVGITSAQIPGLIQMIRD